MEAEESESLLVKGVDMVMTISGTQVRILRVYMYIECVFCQRAWPLLLISVVCSWLKPARSYTQTLTFAFYYMYYSFALKYTF